MDDIPIVPLKGLDLRFEPGVWPFAEARRAEIEAHFVKLRIDKPEMFNGRILLMHRREFAGSVMRGAYLETDFASFIAWRDWGFPDPAICNCFAMAALRSSDGAYILGEMGPHTATAGQIYFAAGTPDRNDIDGDTVDLERGVIRELTEETGLTLADVDVRPGWTATLFGTRIALMKTMQARESAAALRERILAFLAAEPEPELSGIHIVRGIEDLRPVMPPYVRAFLTHRLAK